MKVELAQYQYDAGNHVCVHPRSNEPYISSGAVRVSEYVEVEFTPRDQKEIDAARRVLYTVKREKLQRELAKLDEA